jgi:hypothetical protein
MSPQRRLQRCVLRDHGRWSFDLYRSSLPLASRSYGQTASVSDHNDEPSCAGFHLLCRGTNYTILCKWNVLKLTAHRRDWANRSRLSEREEVHPRTELFSMRYLRAILLTSISRHRVSLTKRWYSLSQEQTRRLRLCQL